LPVDAHLPHTYIPGERLRLEAYKKLAQVVSEEELAEVEAELIDRYGPLPEPVSNLVAVARLRVLARRAGVSEIAVQGNHVRFAPVDLRESQELRLTRLYPKSLYKAGVRTMLVPKPMTARVGGKPLRDLAVLAWASDLIRAVLLDEIAVSGQVAAAGAAQQARGTTRTTERRNR